jgi:hypothetical protein
VCPCIDYQGLNQITVRYSYLLLLIATAIESMDGVHFFTKLGLRSAYNLVHMQEGDKLKTAFSTTSGHYKHLIMPYWLMNVGHVFHPFCVYPVLQTRIPER